METLPPSLEASQPLQHRQIARAIIKAIRHSDLSGPDLKIVLCVLEYSHLAARETAVINRQDNFCLLCGITKSVVSRALKRLFALRVLDAGRGTYRFRPPDEWKTKTRTSEGGHEQQLLLEEWLDRIGQQTQMRLDLFELDEAKREVFTHSVAQEATQPRGSVAYQATPVAQEATSREHPIYVRSNDIKRTTGNGPKGQPLNGQSDFAHKSLWRFFELHCPERLKHEKDFCAGFWLKVARAYPQELLSAIGEGEQKLQGNWRPRESLAAWLNHEAMTYTGFATWSEAFRARGMPNLDEGQ